MNKIERGKKGLIIIGVCALVLAVASLIGAVFVIISGVKSVANQVSVANVFELVGGAILVIISFLLVYVGIYFTWVGASMKATKGSIADGDLCKGTVNMTKCSKCGSQVEAGDEACVNCGASLKKKKTCPKCGAEVRANAKHCTKCGEQF